MKQTKHFRDVEMIVEYACTFSLVFRSFIHGDQVTSN